MFEAEVIKGFTWRKRQDHLFRSGKIITDLTEDDVKYLKENGVIAHVRKMGGKPENAEIVVETAEIKAEEKAVKKVTKKRATNK